MPACSTPAPTPKPWWTGHWKSWPPSPPRACWTWARAAAPSRWPCKKNARVLAVDASQDALTVAQANAQRLGLPVQFRRGHWMEGLEGAFDAIVSNPPYIPAADPHLAALQHEPLQALASGADGLDDIRTIIAQAPAHLVPGGWLLLEHGHDQAPTVCALLQAAGLQAVQTRKDLAGIARCSGGQRPTVK